MLVHAAIGCGGRSRGGIGSKRDLKRVFGEPSVRGLSKQSQRRRQCLAAHFATRAILFVSAPEHNKTMVSTVFASAIVVALTSMASRVNAHGFLVDPSPDFLPGIDVTAYTSTIIGTSLYPDGIFNTYPEGNVNSFVAHFKNDTRFENVRDMILKHQKVIAGASVDCGYTDITKTKHTLNGSSVFWGRNDAANREGFVDSHEGPCEVWCDDNMVQQNMNCVRAYPNKPGNAAEVPIEVAKCANAKKLTFYWIAMHGNEWQIYSTQSFRFSLFVVAPGSIC